MEIPNKTTVPFMAACALVLCGCHAPEKERSLVGLAAYGLALEELGFGFTHAKSTRGMKFNSYEIEVGSDRLEVYFGAKEDQVISIGMTLTPSDPNRTHVSDKDIEPEDGIPIELCEVIARILMPEIREVLHRAYKKEEREGMSLGDQVYHLLHLPPEGELKYRLDELEIGSSTILSNGWRLTVLGQEELAQEKYNGNTYYKIMLNQI